MKHNSFLRTVAACGLSAWLLVMVVGCPKPDATPSGTSPSGTSPSGSAASGHDDHGHGHETSGPHGGHLVEIGDEQLHAEWSHNDATGELVVYLLDSSAESDVAIAAGNISITTKIGEAEKTYELSAVSQEGGQSSKFALTDPALVEALKAVGPGVEATIVVAQNDEQLVGKFERHDHSGHQH